MYSMGNNNRRDAGPWQSQYCAYSTVFLGKENLDEGDKIILPESALVALGHRNVEYPMLFEICNSSLGKSSHCGVMEFTAEEGMCYMPYWMMSNLVLQEGDIINIKNASLAKASYVKLRAQSVDFLEISNPKAMFEVELRKFTCLTEGDTIYINYSDKPYYIDIVEVKPNKKACVVEADVETDFDEPVGYQTSEYKRKEDEAKAAHFAKKNGLIGGGSVNVSVPSVTARVLQKARVDDVDEEKSVFKPFAGSGFRIDGKQTAGDASVVSDAGNKLNAREARAAAALTRQSGGGSAASAPTATDSSSSTVAVEYETRIGDKYSKVKSTVSAFNGPGHKLK